MRRPTTTPRTRAPSTHPLPWAEVDTAGDGFLASFDGPARAIRCAQAIVDGWARWVSKSGPVYTQVSANYSTAKSPEFAVHTWRARSITSRAKRDPRLEHVRDLVAGSGISFEDRGSHELLRVPGEWRLYAVDVPQSA